MLLNLDVMTFFCYVLQIHSGSEWFTAFHEITNPFSPDQYISVYKFTDHWQLTQTIYHVCIHVYYVFYVH